MSEIGEINFPLKVPIFYQKSAIKGVQTNRLKNRTIQFCLNSTPVVQSTDRPQAVTVLHI